MVVLIMGILGSITVGGYRAMQRGMEERGVMENVNHFIRAAYRRAQIDRQPVAVFYWNELLRAETDTDTMIVVGKAVAVRRMGRFSRVTNPYLYDEFADLDQSYDSTDDEGELGRMSGHRLFKYNDESSVPSRMQYSVVADSVYSGDNETVTIFSGGINNRTNLSASAFYNLNTSDREPSGGWKIGDGYAVEFAELQLPEGYVFGGQLPTRAGTVSEFKAVRFDPDSPSSETVEIHVTRPNAQGRPEAVRKAGQAYARENQSV